MFEAGRPSIGNAGPATVILGGLSTGMRSTAGSVVIVASLKAVSTTSPIGR